MSDTPRTDAIIAKDGGNVVKRDYGVYVHANFARQLERELNSIIAKVKAECERWNCQERWDGKNEYCPNCPYELVTRKDE